MSRLANLLKSRRLANAARFVLDDCLPPIVRDSYPLMYLVTRAFVGRGFSAFDMHFKRTAVESSDAEVQEHYRTGSVSERLRDTDLTPEEINFVVRSIAGAGTVLELGAGTGVLAAELAKSGAQVTATDLSPNNVRDIQTRAAEHGLAIHAELADAVRLPYADASFDTVVAAHTLEHVRSFEDAVAEMKRVARERVVIVVPKQRPYRYTVDYHLHFFPYPEALILRVGLERYTCEVITGDLCYVGWLSRG